MCCTDFDVIAVQLFYYLCFETLFLQLLAEDVRGQILSELFSFKGLPERFQLFQKHLEISAPDVVKSVFPPVKEILLTDMAEPKLLVEGIKCPRAFLSAMVRGLREYQLQLVNMSLFHEKNIINFLVKSTKN